MNKLNPSRSLLLERLESRSMLASGMLAFTVDQFEDNQHDASDISQAIDGRSRDGQTHRQRQSDTRVAEENQSIANEFRMTGDRKSHLGRDRAGVLRDSGAFERTNSNPQNFPQSSSRPPNTLPSSQLVVVVELRSPSSDAGPSARPPGVGPQLPSAIRTQDAGPLLFGDATEPDAGGLRLTGSQSGNGEIDQPQDAAAHSNPTNRLQFASPRLIDDVIESNSSAFWLMQNDYEVGNERHGLSNRSGGVIESLPLLRRDLHRPSGTDAEEPWQLDTLSIERIRDVARLPDNHSEVETDQNIDAAIASWFNNQTGLIEIEATGRLHTPVDAVDSIVDVVLDATIGLHRSVDLIAVSVPEIDSAPDDIRGAILAAIAAEQPPKRLDPMTPPTLTRVSAITYPGAALVATCVTLAVRRRRSGATMESTSDQSPIAPE